MSELHLMIAGPVEAYDEVLEALGEQTIPHYGPQFLDLFHETIGLIKQVFHTEQEALMMPGPGTAAIDAALGSLVPRGQGIVILSNGFFGERLGWIAQAYGLHTYTLTVPYGLAVSPDDLSAFLDKTLPQARAEGVRVYALAMCQTETSTGVLNPVRELAAVAKQHDLAVIVDAVASWGALPLEFDAWDLDVVAAVGNKALGVPPGQAVAAVSERAWRMAEGTGPGHGWYLDLRTWRWYIDNWTWHPYPTTMSSNLILALNVGLRRALSSGLEAFQQSFCDAALMTRAGMQKLGFELYPRAEHATSTVSALKGQPGIDLNDMLRYLREEHHIVCSGGLGQLHGQIFRVGHMGKAKDPAVIQLLLDATAQYLAEHADAPVHDSP